MRKIIALLALLVLAGCATLPTDLDVQTGPELVATTGQDFAYYSPSGPVAGATAQEIVSGFLAAGTGPQNDYAVAREFLSQEFAQRWQPEAETLVRFGVPVFRESGDSVLLVDVNVSARVDENGRYSDEQPTSASSLRFQLLQQDGEWRIAAAPNLTVVTAPVFSVVFNAFPVYFVDSRKNALVPDLRWFPSRASTPTKLVNALLAGPTPWLDRGVTTAIPEGTRLTINAVSIENGVARVDFDANALAADNLDRQIMLSQLRSTLLQISGINEVALSVNNSVQEIEPSALQGRSTLGATFVLDDEGVKRLNAVDSIPLSGTEAVVRNYEPTAFSLTDDAARVAFLAETGIYLLEREGPSVTVTRLSETAAVASLEFDSLGTLWVFPSDASQDVEVYDSRGVARTLTSELTGTRIYGAISPEGSRLVQAVVVPTGESIINVQTISRDSTLMPLRINDGFEIKPVIGLPISLTWHGSNAIRVLEESIIGLSTLSEYPLTGPRRPLTVPPIKGKQILSGSSSIATYMISEDGDLWILTGNTWRSNAEGVLALGALR